MKFASPTPELPVPDVEAAQVYYRDHMGFEIAWYNPTGRIGAVSHGDCAVFFRETQGPIAAGTFWIFTEDVDAAHAALIRLGANIVTPVEDTAWGMRQFTLRDPYGHTFYFHHDL